MSAFNFIWRNTAPSYIDVFVIKTIYFVHYREWHCVHYSEQLLSMEDLVFIGRKIAKIRSEKGLSQEDLADAADVNRGYISRIENGHVAFSVPVLLRIAQALDVKAASLFMP